MVTHEPDIAQYARPHHPRSKTAKSCSDEPVAEPRNAERELAELPAEQDEEEPVT